MRKVKSLLNLKIAIFLIAIIFFSIINTKLFAADEVDCVDSDSDGIPDVIEKFLGTDPNKKDTTPIEFARLTVDYYTNSKMNMNRELAENIIRSIAEKSGYFPEMDIKTIDAIAQGLAKTENSKYYMYNPVTKEPYIHDDGIGFGFYGQTADLWDTENDAIRITTVSGKKIFDFKGHGEDMKRDTYYNIDSGLAIFKYNYERQDHWADAYGKGKIDTSTWTLEQRLQNAYITWNGGPRKIGNTASEAGKNSVKFLNNYNSFK